MWCCWEWSERERGPTPFPGPGKKDRNQRWGGKIFLKPEDTHLRGSHRCARLFSFWGQFRVTYVRKYHATPSLYTKDEVRCDGSRLRCQRPGLRGTQVSLFLVLVVWNMISIFLGLRLCLAQAARSLFSLSACSPFLPLPHRVRSSARWYLPHSLTELDGRWFKSDLSFAKPLSMTKV